MSDGGPAIPVIPVTDRPVSAAPALRVAVVSDGRPTLGGPSQPVYVVTDNRPTQGNTPMPVVLATGAQASDVMAGPAIPVVVVSGSLNPTPPFNPATDLTNLLLWSKASAISPVVDATPIASWPDSSGNGRTAAQATAAKQPLYKTNRVNGLPSVLFDGSNDAMDTASIAHGIGTNDWTVAAVVRSSDVTATEKCIGSNGAFVPGWYISQSKPYIWWGSAHIFSTVLVSNTWYLVYYQRIGADVTCYINGVLDANTGIQVGTSMADAAFEIGSDTTGGTFNGDIEELIFCAASQSTAQRLGYESYVRATYAIF